MPKEKKFTTTEVMKLKEAGRSTVTRWCRNGTFPNAERAVDPYGNEYWLIPESDLERADEIVKGRPKKED